MKRLLLLLALAAGLAAGCGGTSSSQHTAHHRITSKCNLNHKLTPAQRRAESRIDSILTAMHRGKTHDVESRLTDRFLLAVGKSNLPIFTQNRLIDHAVAYATPLCQDCFQALEAARPIAALQMRCR